MKPLYLLCSLLLGTAAVCHADVSISPVERDGAKVRVIGGDAAGAMYAGLDVAEAVRIGALAELKSGEHSPHIEFRGIKFNIPLDLRTPPEFPDVALDDVLRAKPEHFDEKFSFRGSGMFKPEMLEDAEVVKRMSIDEKIAFWREVMQMAKDRGVEVYWFTWNTFLNGAEGKHGLSRDKEDENMIRYFRASVRETVKTYPLLAGMGITAGEEMDDNMAGRTKEQWLWPGEDWDSTAFAYRRAAVAYQEQGNATLPADFKPGKYLLALAILDRQGGMMPSVRFATANYFRGGWHPLGFIGIGEAPEDATLQNIAFDLADTRLKRQNPL